jgi:hypothetical protein
MSDEVDRFRGPWFDSKTASEYVCCKNVRAFYSWAKRHHIIRRSNGSVAKADLDRALKARRRITRRGRHPNSLANLKPRMAIAPAAEKTSTEVAS